MRGGNATGDLGLSRTVVRGPGNVLCDDRARTDELWPVVLGDRATLVIPEMR